MERLVGEALAHSARASLSWSQTAWVGYSNRVTGNADGHDARAMTITVKADRIIRKMEVVPVGGAQIGEV